MTETVYEYWESLRPEKCRGCECAELDWDFEGTPIWGCELKECYHTSLPSEKT